MLSETDKVLGGYAASDVHVAVGAPSESEVARKRAAETVSEVARKHAPPVTHVPSVSEAWTERGGNANPDMKRAEDAHPTREMYGVEVRQNAGIDESWHQPEPSPGNLEKPRRAHERAQLAAQILDAAEAQVLALVRTPAGADTVSARFEKLHDVVARAIIGRSI